MGKGRRGSRTDYDGAWKQALDLYLEPFLRLCFPTVHAGIDWSQKATSRDTELQQIVRSTTTGKRHVDKLVEVRRRDGAKEWLLVHLEVQSQPDRHLPERMYEYHRRIRMLYERGYSQKDVVGLFRLIDWLIQLPAKLTIEIKREITDYEDQKRMPYITSIERIGRRQGRQEGRQQGRLEGREEGRLLAARDAVRLVLESRFGQVPTSILDRLACLDALDRLELLLRRASTADSLTEFKRSL